MWEASCSTKHATHAMDHPGHTQHACKSRVRDMGATVPACTRRAHTGPRLPDLHARYAHACTQRKPCQVRMGVHDACTIQMRAPGHAYYGCARMPECITSTCTSKHPACMHAYRACIQHACMHSMHWRARYLSATHAWYVHAFSHVNPCTFKHQSAPSMHACKKHAFAQSARHGGMSRVFWSTLQMLCSVQPAKHGETLAGKQMTLCK